MTDIPPPEQPGWYADAHGAWWWWDGQTWSPAPGGAPVGGGPGPRQQERTQALLMWILFLVLGGWIVALIFYVISKEKPYVRHHAAEALNLTLVTLVPQIIGFALLVPGYIGYIGDVVDDPEATFEPSGTFWLGLVLVMVVGLVNLVLCVMAAVQASRGRWWRLPIGLHPVRGVLRKGEAPPYDVGT